MAEISKEIIEVLVKAENADEVIRLAKEHGIDVPSGTENEFYEKIMALKGKMPISDDDLEIITGGMSIRRGTYTQA